MGASTGYTVFVWLFGIFAGGYHYALKVFVFEKVIILVYQYALKYMFVLEKVRLSHVRLDLVGYDNQSATNKILFEMRSLRKSWGRTRYPGLAVKVDATYV